MTVSETISLIKNYEEQLKNYYLYMHKINLTLMNNIAYVNEIKARVELDQVLKNRLISLGNTSNGLAIQKLFSELFKKENTKVR